jgi:hypothetical protein
MIAAAAITMVAALGHAANANAAIVVRLQQVTATGTPVTSVLANANPAQQTLAYADVIVSGTGAPLPVADIFSFASILGWTSLETTSSNLYTVNTAGTPTIGSTAMSVNTPGFMFANPDPELNAQGDMNVNGVESAYQRYVSVTNFETSALSDPQTPLTIARIRFAIAAGVTEATFNISLAGTGPTVGFFNGGDPIAFPTGSGTIAVVPEPGTTATGVLGFLVMAGLMARRCDRVRRTLSCIASAA